MCLAVPAQVVAIADGEQPHKRHGVVDLAGNRVEVSLALVPDVQVGAWVLVHAGMALEELEPEAAAETWQWLREAGLGTGP